MANADDSDAPATSRTSRAKARSGSAGGSGSPDARRIAATVIERVEREAAYAAAALDAELSRHPQLDRRERAFATELVYGVLRTRAALLERIERHARRGAGKDAAVRAHLLVAAYQILLLDRIPARAAVDTAVSAVRAARGAKVAGFANAVLRKVAGDRDALDAADAAVRSAPTWLRRQLEEAVGEAEARALLVAGADAGGWDSSVAVRLVGAARPAWVDEAEPGRASPLARRLRGGGDLRELEGYDAGAFVVQEEGAQVVALALGARPGDRVLDVCAGRGTKTTLLSEQVGAGGEVWAVDVHPRKLEALVAEHDRLGLPRPHTEAVDLSVGTAELPGAFDRVLVDAPCTGVGSLRRRPEIALRLRPEDPARLAKLSSAILRNAASLARPGGRVVFAVCSVLREECEEVVERVSDVLEPVELDAPLVGHVASGTAFHLLPGRHGTEGYFVASFRRRA